jgi:hypothetical protein
VDERGLKKLHAAAVHLREVANQAWAVAGRQEQKVERYRELLAEAEAGLTASQEEANRADAEAGEAEEKSSHWRNVERGIERVYAHAQSADVKTEAREG